MRTCDMALDHATLPDGARAVIGIEDGHIVAIESGPAAVHAAQRHDLEGALVLPGLIDGHVHLDKTFLGDGWKPHRPCTAGFDVRERVMFEKELLKAAAPVSQRASALVECAVARGTTHMRSHFDVDPEAGLRNLHALLDVRERYRHMLSIQLVAFPQSGILTCPGTRVGIGR